MYKYVTRFDSTALYTPLSTANISPTPANINRNLPNIYYPSPHLVLTPNFRSLIKFYLMKKLEKLVTKKVTAPEEVKGGLMALQPEFSLDDQSRTTENAPSWNGQHWVTDVKKDPK